MTGRDDASLPTLVDVMRFARIAFRMLSLTCWLSENFVMPRKRPPNERLVIGWREWVGLPDLSLPPIKAKIDTGARTSCLHAYHVRIEESADGPDQVHFDVHPHQRNAKLTIHCVADLLERRWVRSSNGMQAMRVVIKTRLEMLGRSWPIELTLANRDMMGFRMLIGRQAMRKRLVVDPALSFVCKPQDEESKS